jgi:hypothetical protein
VTAFESRGVLGRAVTLGVAVCLLAAARPAGAQERMAVGAQVGYSRADLTGQASDLVESRQGAVTGVYLHLPLNRLLSVRPEILFSLKGGTTLAQVSGSSTIALVDIELAYLELPLLARLTLPRGRFRPAVFGGPSAGLQIGCDFLIIIMPADSVRRTCGEDDITGVREWDLGWIAGAAIEMHLPRTTLALQGRYSTGFRSVLENVDLRNRGMAVLFGLTF